GRKGLRHARGRRGRGRHGRDRALRPRHVREQDGEVQPRRARHDRRRLRAAAREAQVEARRVREHRQRERAVRRGAVGSGARDRDGDAHGRRDVRHAVRRPVRRGVLARSGRRRSRRQGVHSRSVRVCEEIRCGVVSARRAAAHGALAPRRQWGQGGQPRAVPGSEGRPERRRAEPRLDAPAGAARRREAARAVSRASGARAAHRLAGAPEERDGSGEIRVGARKARDGAGAEDASDPRGGRKEQMRSALIGLALASVTAAAVTGVARSEPQRFGGGWQVNQGPPIEYQGNTPYDGRFVFIRLRYGFGGFGGRMRGGPPWSHDYPRGEVHFTKILKEITYANPRTDGSNILSLDDPELFNYPVAYMAEPGFWSPTDKEAESLRAYLKKG